jgi:hypothetical protein
MIYDLLLRLLSSVLAAEKLLKLKEKNEWYEGKKLSKFLRWKRNEMNGKENNEEERENIARRAKREMDGLHEYLKN